MSADRTRSRQGRDRPSATVPPPTTSGIEEKLSNLTVERGSYQPEMFRKERASFKLNKSSKGRDGFLTVERRL